MVFPGLFYICWDIWFAGWGVWRFDPAYTVGFKLYDLPVEEVLFFFVVPYCCLFIYVCIRSYFPLLRSNKRSETILFLTAVLLFVLALIFHEKRYTFYTGLFNAIFIFIIFLLRKKTAFFNSAAFLATYAIILLPFMAVNGLLTSLPVVIYNNTENTGLRIFSIPVEDIFYGMLLIMMNVFIYEQLLQGKLPAKTDPRAL